MSSQPSGKNMKTKHIKAVSQKVKLFRASEPLLSVLMWGINHSVRKSASLISNVRILDDFRSLCIIETRNVLHQTCNSIKTITHDTMNYKNNINSLVCKLQSWSWAQLRVGDRGQRQLARSGLALRTQGVLTVVIKMSVIAWAMVRTYDDYEWLCDFRN